MRDRVEADNRSQTWVHRHNSYLKQYCPTTMNILELQQSNRIATGLRHLKCAVTEELKILISVLILKLNLNSYHIAQHKSSRKENQ